MKKKLILFLGIVMAIALLSACSDKGESSESNSDSGASSGSGETYEISYSTWANPGEPAYEGMEKFKEIVEEKTDGNIKVDLFPSNQLGTTEEQMEQVKLGTIQMMSSGNPGLQEIEYLSLPYLMKSNAHWKHVLDSDVGQEWNEKLINEMGIRNIGILPRGPRVISANKEYIHQMIWPDLKLDLRKEITMFKRLRHSMQIQRQWTLAKYTAACKRV